MPRKKKSDNGAEKIKKRVTAMVKERPSHKEVLEFYKDIVLEQNSALSKIKTSLLEIDKEDAKEKTMQGFPLMEKKAFILDIPSATRLFRKLCKILSKTKKGQHDSERIIQAMRKKEIKLPELFKQIESGSNEYIINLSEKLQVNPDVLSFLATNSIKPIYEMYAKELGNYVDQERWWKGYCPICGSEPFMAELKELGARFLVCSSCSYEWRFKRLQCPFCEHEAPQGAKYLFTKKEGKVYRVDVCEECKRYIKTVDTKELGEDVIPLIEDAGTLYLDIVAQKEGYIKEGKASGLTTNA
ncbi:MAG: formate dehydrogenase accessory protein FdhE [Nitrospirota bacterium]